MRREIGVGAFLPWAVGFHDRLQHVALLELLLVGHGVDQAPVDQLVGRSLRDALGLALLWRLPTPPPRPANEVCHTTKILSSNVLPSPCN